MGACKKYSRWVLIWAASLLAVSSSGCAYSLRPMRWLVHNAVPSTCKSCPGGLPGSNGCRSFENPWCAGYETTLWQHLGKDCGPARLPSALASLDADDSSNGGTENSEAAAGDDPPELPDAFPSPLPEPGNLPPALPDLPSSETDLPPTGEFPFPVSPVPNSPPGEDSGNPLRDPNEPEAPTTSPDLFPESRPTTPAPGEKKPSPSEKTSPAKEPPLVIPEKIDDLFNDSEKPAPEDSSPSGVKLPDDFPSFENGPSPKKPESLPEPERKTPTKEPVNQSEPTPNELPKLFDQGDEKPAPTKRTPELPEPNRIPNLPPLNETSPKKSAPDDDPAIPKLFDDSSYQPQPELKLGGKSNATLRFGRVLPASGVEEPILRVQPAGGTVDLKGGIYGPDHALQGPPQPLLRIKQKQGDF